MFKAIYRDISVVVKCPPDDADLVVFEKEAEMSCQVAHSHHPNVVDLIGVCTTPPNVCMVFVYVPGGDLKKLLMDERKYCSTSPSDVKMVWR